MADTSYIADAWISLGPYFCAYYTLQNSLNREQSVIRTPGKDICTKEGYVKTINITNLRRRINRLH